MRSFWTESQKKKKKEKNNFSFLFYFLIKHREGEKQHPCFLLPASSLLPCMCPSILGLFNNSNSSSECVKPRNTLYCVWTRSHGQ